MNIKGFIGSYVVPSYILDERESSSQLLRYFLGFLCIFSLYQFILFVVRSLC
ncbi:hypothetical protein HanXRQr2_Chr11g0516181 [Helianthus annuus]|uniref:Uncharacterized protein n=1 Tax=Helianthus annuus TaxID=4232 RepID=A0A9K3HTT9_HELAN|nr:hypothetical protein HanXRQr2_Chr11g0516181 [Helianthus annuus]KAJ0877211.1 hypothetical protein HanPSC8_Chr11g0497481 [Helianthus annuus]